MNDLRAAREKRRSSNKLDTAEQNQKFERNQQKFEEAKRE
jgi:hypothetical protein